MAAASADCFRTTSFRFAFRSPRAVLSLKGSAIRALVLVLAIVGLSANVQAAPPFGASGGSGPSTTSSYNLAGTGWVVDDGSFPAAFGFQEVAFDPTAGPWHKRLVGIDGGDFAASDTGVPALMIFGVSEWVTVGGTVPWTDWHEEIMQPGWRWLDDRAGSGEPSFHYASGVTVPGLTVAFTDPTLSEGGKIDITFDPIPPGTLLRFNKRLIYEGLDPLLPGDTFLGTLDIFEHPTVPEPTTLLLLITGLAAAWLARARG